jgi:hypothetical protein
MWGITSLDSLDTSSKYQHLGRPEKIDAYPPSGCEIPYPGWRADLVKPAVIPESLIQETIYLGDFGLAIRKGSSVQAPVSGYILCPRTLS